MADRDRQKKRKEKPLKLDIKRSFFPPFEVIPQNSEKTFDGPQGFGAKLVKKGYFLLGSGMFSRVYGKRDSDKVIKVTHRSDGWIGYAHWAAREGFAGTFAPRVYSYKKFANAKHPFEVAVVERIEKTFWKTDRKDPAVVTKKLAELAMEGNPKAIELVESMAPGICIFVHKLINKYGHLDDHGANIMVRKDGSICWTDPITFGHELKSTRLRSADFLH